MEDTEKLIEQERFMKVGGLFHDLGSSIGLLMDSLELIEEYSSRILAKSQEDKEISEYAGNIKGKCMSCKNRIKFMRDMRNAVVSQLKQEISPYENFTVEDLVKRVCTLAKEDLDKHACTLEVKLDIKPDTKIAGKEVNLMQVLNNLITNAADAYGHGGAVSLTVTLKDGNVLFSVSDTAGGISKEIQQKLLKEIVSSKGENGNGLGVYLSCTIIKECFKGSMSFETKEGIGTTFFISIPYIKNMEVG